MGRNEGDHRKVMTMLDSEKFSKSLLAGFLGAFLVVVGMTRVTTVQAEKTEARTILAETGIKGGLIVHAGCGDGKLKATLCTSEHFIVHGLDRPWHGCLLMGRSGL